jgi:hypothetical protein
MTIFGVGIRFNKTPARRKVLNAAEFTDKWQSLSAKLDQVLDLDGEQRARRLESLVKSDPEMAERVSAALAARKRQGDLSSG